MLQVKFFRQIVNDNLEKKVNTFLEKLEKPPKDFLMVGGKGNHVAIAILYEFHIAGEPQE